MDSKIIGQTFEELENITYGLPICETVSEIKNYFDQLQADKKELIEALKKEHDKRWVLLEEYVHTEENGRGHVKDYCPVCQLIKRMEG